MLAMISLTACLFMGFVISGTAFAQMTARVSVGNGGIQVQKESHSPALSANGRFVAFASWAAANLDPTDTNSAADIYVRDRALLTTTRVSVGTGGHQANYASYDPSISADGRFVVFLSSATNLVPGDTNLGEDVFLHDRVSGTTVCLSVDSSGVPGNSSSQSARISANGHFIAFDSHASNLVAGDTNDTWDVFVHSRLTGITSRVSLSSSGVQSSQYSAMPSISANGSRVAFVSAGRLTSPSPSPGTPCVYVRDLAGGMTTCASVDIGGTPVAAAAPSISGDGRYVAFYTDAAGLVPNDSNGVADIFVRDLSLGTTEIVSVDSNGIQGRGASTYPSISSTGRFVVFWSHADTLVANDANGSIQDIFIRDRGAGTTSLVSVNSFGSQANGHSYHCEISLNGKHVAFASESTNLVHGDTNARADVFVRTFP